MTHHPTAKGIVNAWQNFAVADRVFLKDIPSCCSGLLNRLPTASSVCCFGFSLSPFPSITVGVISLNLFRFHQTACHSFFLRVLLRFSAHFSVCLPKSFFIHLLSSWGKSCNSACQQHIRNQGGFVCLLCIVPPGFCSALEGFCCA